MKTFLMILLMACGRHETPPALDLGDEDGDQIVNQFENGLDKYVAEIEDIRPVSGIMHIPITNNQEEEIKFSTGGFGKKDVVRALVSNPKLFQMEEHFNEWAKLKLKKRSPITFAQSIIEVWLNFDTDKSNASSIYFVKGNTIRRVAKWDLMVKFPLSGDELNSILNGTASLSLGNPWVERIYAKNKNQAEVIKETTYRVFYHDGETSKVLYVSNRLAFNELHQYLKSEKINRIEEHEVFLLNPQLKTKRWWSRELSKGVKVLAYLDNQQLIDSYLTLLERKEFKLERLNGEAQNSYVFHKPVNAKVYLILRGSKTNRVFGDLESKETFLMTDPIGATDMYFNITCHFKKREILNESEEPLQWSEIVTSLNLDSGPSPARHRRDEFGSYWMLALDQARVSIELKLTNKSVDSYNFTGFFHNSCRPKIPHGPKVKRQATHVEGQMNLKVEAYVEKID